MPLAAHAAAGHDGWPPPGLYRVQTVADTINGVAQPSGGASHTHCMPARTAAAPPAFLANSSCSNATYQRTKDGTIMRQQCPFGELMTTVRQVDATTWEFSERDKLNTGSSTGDPRDTLKTLRAIAERQAKHAPTAKERAQAARDLAQWPALEAEMMQQHKDMTAMQSDVAQWRAAAEAQGLPSVTPPMMQVSSVTRLTRIADKCAQPNR
jgi:hypothetical protein